MADQSSWVEGNSIVWDLGEPLNPSAPVAIGIENPYMPRKGSASDQIVALMVNYGAAQEALFETLKECNAYGHGQSNFKRDLQYAKQKYPSKRYPEARKELDTTDQLHDRIAWIRESLAHGRVVKYIMAAPVPVRGEGIRAEWMPTAGGYYSVESGNREVRLDDVDRLTRAAEIAKDLLLAVYRFRRLALEQFGGTEKYATTSKRKGAHRTVVGPPKRT